MLCANLIYTDPVTFILIHLNQYFMCSFYYDTLIVQIDLVLKNQAETQNRG